MSDAGTHDASGETPTVPVPLDRLIVDSADIGIVTFDRELRYTRWNPFMEELLGKPGAERIGRTPEEMWAPHEMPFPGYMDNLRRALAGEHIVLHPANPHRQPDGSVRYGHVSAGPLRACGGEIVGVLITVHDNTARVLAEQSLRRREQILEGVGTVARLLLGSPLEECAVEALGVMGNAVGASRAYIFQYLPHGDVTVDRQLWEWCADGVPSDPWADMVIEGSDFEWAIERFRQGEAVHGPVTDWPAESRGWLDRAGIVSLAIVPIFVEGTLWGDVGFDDCVTPRAWSAAEVDALGAAASVFGAAISRQRAAEALRESEARRDHSQRIEAVGRLAGGVAHDFNNLLTVISGHLDLLRRQLPEGSRALGDVREIASAAERATGLARQLLTFSRRQVVQPRTVDLNEVVRDVEAMLRRLITEHVEMMLELAPHPVHVVADPLHLQQVVVNLAVNARDAMPAGGVLTIGTATAPSVPNGPGARAVLRVADTGTGIDPAILGTIFEPFFTTKARGEGVGLGLATTHGIVTAAGGTIGVESTAGVGSTFTVELPLADSNDVTAPDPDPDDGAVADLHGVGSILLVEDEPALRALAATVLEQHGYSVVAAADGVEGLALVRSGATPFDLLVTDVVMPRMSGRELAEQVREVVPTLPIVFMSGYTDDELRGPFPDSSFLQKAFTPAELVQMVRDALEAHAVR